MRVLLLVPLLCTGVLAAQAPTHISPLGAVAGLGNSNNDIPFSWTPTAYQQVHDLSSFSSTQAVPITKLSLRMGDGFTNATGYTIDVELWMASSPNSAANAQSVFAANVSAGTEVNVFPRNMVNLAPVPNHDWRVTFPFTTPWVFNSQNHVSWRAIVWGNSNGNRIFTYPLDAFWDIGSARTTGSYQGCASATGTQAASLTVSSDLHLRIGLTPVFTGKSYVAAGSLPAILTIGASSTSYYGVPLPYDLGALGAPGCMITNDILVTVAGVTQSGPEGSVALPVQIPNDLKLEGGTFYTQYLFLQQGANLLGQFSSNGLTNRIAVPPRVARIFAAGNPNATAGSLTTQFGMAIGLN